MTENAKSRASAQTSEIWKEISEVTVDNIESEVESRSGSSEESDKRLVTLYKSDITLEQLSEVTQALERYTIEMPTLEDSRRLIQAV
ncbi:MAG: hypothetical protein K0R67_3446, partial [Paenibacillus sp.]|nr:hypothetical protein [Paenibacillus sp.]